MKTDWYINDWPTKAEHQARKDYNDEINGLQKTVDEISAELQKNYHSYKDDIIALVDKDKIIKYKELYNKEPNFGLDAADLSKKGIGGSDIMPAHDTPKVVADFLNTWLDKKIQQAQETKPATIFTGVEKYDFETRKNIALEFLNRDGTLDKYIEKFNPTIWQRGLSLMLDTIDNNKSVRVSLLNEYNVRIGLTQLKNKLGE